MASRAATEGEAGMPNGRSLHGWNPQQRPTLTPTPLPVGEGLKSRNLTHEPFAILHLAPGLRRRAVRADPDRGPDLDSESADLGISGGRAADGGRARGLSRCKPESNRRHRGRAARTGD